MSLSRISGSKAGLLLKCAYSFRDDIDVPPQEPPGEPALIGTEVHRAIADYLQGKSPDSSNLSPKARELYESWRNYWVRL